MLSQPLHILLIEDNPADARLVEKMLLEQRGGHFQLSRAETLSEGQAYLAQAQPDLILLDLGLPDAEGLECISAVMSNQPPVPVVVLSGQNDESLALKAVQMGGQDYLPKDRLTQELLKRTIRYAIERHRILQALAESEQRKQQEREHQNVARLAAASLYPSVTSQLYGTAQLSESLPETFESLAERYGTVLDLALDAQMHRHTPEPSPHLRELAQELGFLRASPRDVTELHVVALNHKVDQASLIRKRVYYEEGRIVLIELMGHLLSYYRTQSLGLPFMLGQSPT